MLRTVALALLTCLSLTSAAPAQDNRIDVVSPLAPELAAYGPYPIGVRTIEVTDRDRVDIIRTSPGGPTARYDRRLTLEIWYPARLAAGQQPRGDYRVVTRDPAVTATLHGKAVRNAEPTTTDGPFPLVLVSHGYPGNRFLMSHLCENLASKGYVVAAIDHRESTYDDQQAFASTLFNRPYDQLFVLNEIARLSATKAATSAATPAADPSSGSGPANAPGARSAAATPAADPNASRTATPRPPQAFLAGLVDSARTGLVGYSMGGYGLVNVIGGGFSDAGVTASSAPPNRLLAQRAASNPDYMKTVDGRIRAAIAIAPWGMQVGYWDVQGLGGIRTPVLFVAGSADTVAGYETGTKAIFQGATHADRYLLTFLNANHNAGAPIPAPAETYRYSETLKSYPFVHYADAIWDSVRMNNILDHFATAYFDLHLKGRQDRQAYLEPVQGGDLKGFQRRTSLGLTLEHEPAR